MHKKRLDSLNTLVDMQVTSRMYDKRERGGSHLKWQKHTSSTVVFRLQRRTSSSVGSGKFSSFMYKARALFKMLAVRIGYVKMHDIHKETIYKLI